MHPALQKCSLFFNVPEAELRTLLDAVPHPIRRFAKGEILFRQMEKADRIGIILEGRVQAQKPFPNGSQINVSVGTPGDLVGAAAAFSESQRYPCDVAALEPAAVMVLRKKDVLSLMQKDLRVLENMTRQIATAVYMLQQRLELLSYHGIAQKAACFLLIRSRHTETQTVRIPGSVSNWAMILHVSRPSLHRELRSMEAAGLIAYTPPTIRILDAEALQALLRQ